MHANVNSRCFNEVSFSFIGLAQGVLDNIATPNTFRLLVERRSSSSSSSSFPTLLAHQASLETIHSLYAFPQRGNLPLVNTAAGAPLVNVTSSQFKSVSFLRPDVLPCDVHLLNLRTMRAAPHDEADFTPRTDNKVALLLHRLGTECLQCRLVTSTSSEDGHCDD